MTSSRSLVIAVGGVSSASRIWYSPMSCSMTVADSLSSWSTQPPRPRTTVPAMSVEEGFSGRLEEVDLVRGHGLHRLDAGRLDAERLPQPGVRQDFTHLRVVRHLDVAGDVDLVDAELDRQRDLVVRVAGAAVQYEGDLNAVLDLPQQVELELRLQGLRIEAVVGADGNGEAVDTRCLDEGDGVQRVGVDDGVTTVLGLAVGL